MNRFSGFTAALIGLVLCGAVAGTAQAQQNTVQIDGSSTVYPVTEAIAEEFQKANRGVKVTVGISGTGGGFKRFCRGETDISGASRPISKLEMEACRKAGIRYFELPVAYDAITVMVNPRNDWITSMSVAELKKIWEPAARGTVMRWNQVNPAWPDAPITLYAPGADSGTFEYFTEAVVGRRGASRSDFTASEDDNVLVQGIATDRNALGYFGFSYYIANTGRLKAVAIDGGKGPVLPTSKTIENGTYSPLSRPIFLYVSEAALSRPEVKRFVDFYLDTVPALAKEVGYVALPARAYALGKDHLKKGKVGTVFGGEAAVDISIEQLMTREMKF